MPPSSFLTPKPPTLLRVSESQAISNSSSFISSTSSSSLFDRVSDTSSGYITDFSSPFSPSTAGFGSREGDGPTQPSDSPIKDQASPSRDSESVPSQSRQPHSQLTKISLSTRLDRACALGSRSSTRSYSQNGTTFVSLIPIAVTKNEDRRYLPASDSEDTFDSIAVLRNRLERGNPTVATRCALEIMDSGLPGIGGVVEAPVKVVVSGPHSPVEDWSNDFELGSSSDMDVSILFPSASDRGLLDEVEQDSVSSPILPNFSVKFPSTPVLDPVTLASPCSPFTLGTPALSTNWENSRSSISTLMAESPPPSPISSPANVSFDDEQMARIMHTVLSLPSRTRHLFSGSPDVVDVTTAMHVEIASESTLPAGRTGTLIGLGVAMPVIYPPLPPTLFPLHHPPGTALNSRRVFSLRDLGYQPFDDRMLGIEQASSSSSVLLSRNVHESSEPSGLGFEINNDSLLLHSHSTLEGCTAPTSHLSEVDFDCSSSDDDASRVEQTLSRAAHTTTTTTNPKHTSQIAFRKALVGLGLGLDTLTEASVESQSPPPEPSPTISHGMQIYFISRKIQFIYGLNFHRET